MSAQSVAVTAEREPARLRVVPVPQTEPPVQTVLYPLSPRHRLPGYVQEMLAVDFAPEPDDGYFGPQPTRSAHLPMPVPWADRMVRLLLEVIDGTRPSSQVRRNLDPEIHERVARAGVVARQSRRRPRPHVVLAVRVCEPTDGVAEVAAVVRTGARSRALAMRMVGIDGRWLVTALQLG